jgi:16S rRNA (guanine(527)-N(7))-methyltransferase RsmG
MGVELPDLGPTAFGEALAAALGRARLEARVEERLFCHYVELRAWARKLSLIGPGTVHEVLVRHYGESLAALPLLDPCRRLVDVGSGAGFPGWVLAAARPDIEVWLVESSSRKAAFLRSAAHKAALACTVLDARVAGLVPSEFPRSVDVVTVRAVRLSRGEWSALGERVEPDGRLLRWVGPSPPPPPSGWTAKTSQPIAGCRRAVEMLVRDPAPESGR